MCESTKGNRCSFKVPYSHHHQLHSMGCYNMLSIAFIECIAGRIQQIIG